MIAAEKARELFQMHGRVRPQPIAEWTGEIPLPEPVIQYFQNVGPENIRIRGYGNPYFFPSLASLWDFQAGYRWNGLTNERINDWRDEWLVVADEGGDPFIYSMNEGTILTAMHGAGEWKPHQIFSDLNGLACLAVIGSVIKDAGREFTDEDSMIRPRYIEKLTADLTPLLGTEVEAKSVLWNLGYLISEP